MTNSYDNLVDVIIPVYNGETYVARAIESAVNQTCRPNRIIVVDDCSNDSTEQIVRGLAASNCLVEYYRLETNLGPSSARNYGIKLSTAQFISFLDSDDLWDPNKIGLQIDKFHKSEYGSDLGLVYTNCRDIDQDDHIAYNNTFELNKKVKGNVTKWLKKANLIAGSCSSVLIKRECLDLVGVFDTELEACEDWDLWLRISKSFNFDYVNMNLVFIRRHPQNSQWNIPRMFSGHLKFYSKMYENGDLIFARIMGFRAWIFRNVCNINSVYDLVRYAFNPSMTVSRISYYLQSNPGWNSELCSEKFKSYFLSKSSFFFLLNYLLMLSVLSAIKRKLSITRCLEC